MRGGWTSGAPSGTAGSPPEPYGVHEWETELTVIVKVKIKHECDVDRIDLEEMRLSEELTELVSKAVEQEYPDAEIDGDMDTTILD